MVNSVIVVLVLDLLEGFLRCPNPDFQASLVVRLLSAIGAVEGATPAGDQDGVARQTLLAFEGDGHLLVDFKVEVCVRSVRNLAGDNAVHVHDAASAVQGSDFQVAPTNNVESKSFSFERIAEVSGRKRRIDPTNADAGL